MRGKRNGLSAQKQTFRTESLGLYPGAIGTNPVVLPEEPNTGAPSFGLGEPENLAPFLALSKATEMALPGVPAAAQKPARTPIPTSDHWHLGCWVGSGYANLSFHPSMPFWRRQNANIKTKGAGKTSR